ncbi:MAG: PAS domain S-box protein, partial [Candidatus Aminicenantaceae bacterium]
SLYQKCLQEKNLCCGIAVAGMLGYTEEEMEGKHLFSFMDEEWVNEAKKNLKKRREGVVEQYEFKFRKKSGESVYMLSNTSPIFDEQGNYTGALAVIIDITERKQAEEALRENEEHYRAVVEYSHNGILIVGEDYKFIYVNDVLCQILDRKREEIIGSDFRKFLDKESKLLVDDRYKKRQRGEVVPSRYEFNIVRKNGEKRRVEISSTIVKDSQNRIKTIAQILDITDRRQAEKALQESERKYRSIIENSNDGIYFLYNRKFEIINNKFEQMFGYSLEEVNKPDFDFIQLVAPISRPLVEDRVKRASRGEELIPKYEFTALSKDGEELEVEASVTYINYKQGIATQGIIRDVTERKKAVEALKEREQLLSNVFESMHEGVFVINNEYEYTYWNKAMERISNTQRKEVLGRIPWKKFPFLKGRVEKAIKKAMRGHVSLNIELSYILSNGKKGCTRENYLPLKDSNNNIIGVVGVVEDITERIKTEEALRENEEKYRALVENAGEVILVAQDGVLKFVNRRVFDVLGFKPEELVENPLVDYIHPEDKKTVSEKHKKRQRGEDFPSVYPSRIIDKKGKTNWMEINAARIEWEGKPATLNFLTDVTERLQTEKQIRENLKEKEILLKEVHHRVKNNLNVITSLLNLQSSRLRSKEQAIDAFKESKDRIYAMAMVHEKLYQSGSYSKIDMQDYIKTLAEKLLQIYAPPTKISRSFIIDENINIDINRAIPCGLILNELITNALKHAFAGRSKGKLIVSFHCSENRQYEIKVKDNGIGLPKDIDNKKVETLGLNLIFILTEQLNGKLSIKTKKETEIRIVFPISKK